MTQSNTNRPIHLIRDFLIRQSFTFARQFCARDESRMQTRQFCPRAVHEFRTHCESRVVYFNDYFRTEAAACDKNVCLTLCFAVHKTSEAASTRDIHPRKSR